ncbi:MAG TPA: hypothetical protein VK307_10495 [Thermoleophilaceae bacterium]|nr:hypothetical protein [Thermoleophilaceae bacterium]
MSDATPQERIRTLLLRGDNLLKSGRPERLPRALEAFEQAADVAKDPAVRGELRELVERRRAAARAIDG